MADEEEVRADALCDVPLTDAALEADAEKGDEAGALPVGVAEAEAAEEEEMGAGAVAEAEVNAGAGAEAEGAREGAE